MDALKRLPNGFQRKPVVVCVVDGIGIGKPVETNGFYMAKKPYFERLRENSRYMEIGAHGTFVGLPSDEDIGNSEVGHNTLGVGRILPQGASLVNSFFQENGLEKSPQWRRLIKYVLDRKSKLHFLGLLSDGNVHSHIDHLKILIEQAMKENVKEIRIHALLDGRDVSPKSAEKYIQNLEDFLKRINEKYGAHGAIASCGGRENVTMDRYEANWEKVAKGWRVHVEADAPIYPSALEGLEAVRQKGEIDQFLEPFVVGEGEPLGPVRDGDAVLTFNFRGDRVIEISRAFEERDLKFFQKRRHPEVFYMGMLLYDGDKHIPKNFLIEAKKVDDTMGFYQTKLGQKIFAVSETQKYGHVTYFWNGNRSGKIVEDLETYVEIKSDLGDFDKNPAMKSKEITDEVIRLLKTGAYDGGRINYPNGDMVGHTGNLKAVIASIEALDEQLGRLVKAIDEIRGVLIVVADHGNCEEMVDEEGSIKTSHTKNKVPFYLYDPQFQNEYRLRKNPNNGLANVAATVFNLMGYEAPKHYSPSLIEFLL